MKIKRIFAKNKFFIISSFLMFFVYLWVAAQIPYTHDDWDWGLQLGMQHLLSADINSRYTGNLIEVMITRNTALKNITLGLVFTWIPAAIAIFAGKISLSGEERSADLIRTILFLFSNFMIMALPIDVWRQTNGWIAGFSNFVVSGLALLLYFNIMIRLDRKAEGSKKALANGIGLAVFGMVIQLFLENLTIFFMLFTLFYLFFYRKRKDIIWQIMPLLLGNLAGLLIMFSSSIYSSLWNTGYAVGTYRRLMYDPAKPLYTFILESGKRYLGEFVPKIVSHDGILTGSIAAMMALMIIKKREKSVRTIVLSVINMLYFLYYVYSYFRGNPLLNIHHMIGIGLDCFFVVLMIVETFILFNQDKQLLFWLVVLWLAPFLMLAPMIMINTAGPRTYYTTYICFILIGGIILSALVSRRPRSMVAALSVLCLIAVAGISFRWIKIYEPIGNHIRERERMIETAILNGDKRIVFSQYPNSEYLWLPDPLKSQPWRIPCFKEFYHIPEDVDIWFESYDK